jgi:hypothetical protein
MISAGHNNVSQNGSPLPPDGHDAFSTGRRKRAAKKILNEFKSWKPTLRYKYIIEIMLHRYL